MMQSILGGNWDKQRYKLGEIEFVKFLYHFKLLPPIVATNNLNSTEFDSIIAIAQDISSVPFDVLKKPLNSYLSLDESAEKGVFMVSCDDVPAKKVIFSGTGKLENDWDDVR